MRRVWYEGPIIKVSEDAHEVIGDFLGFALSLKAISGRPPAEEFAERFSPSGSGMRLPDTFAAYRAEEPDDIPPEFGDEFARELEHRELWVLTRLRFGGAALSAVVEGTELRRLLDEALALRTALASSEGDTGEGRGVTAGS
ncbi:MAG TPA: hypothetical protein VHJ17_07385 [Thermomonospora sp.]|nr:hypothetical protein [Thermomonospora sp.]